jgi:uncharacterized protein
MVQFYKVKKKYVLRAGIFMGLTLMVISLVMNSLRVNDYAIQVAKIRKEKDVYLKESEDSPIGNQDAFRGLNYFDPHQKYKVTARLRIIDSLSIIKVLRNDGKLTEYKRFAQAKFTLDQVDYTVVLLKSLDQADEDASLFLPFTDLSNGKETYHGGRYIDLHWVAGKKTIEIDFNLAYNPYCVYSYKYSCPIPPRENFIQTSILAGEKNFLQEE